MVAPSAAIEEPEAAADPPSAAAGGLDRDVPGMVARALERGDTLLAYQPVVQARRPGRVAFHEALIRLRDDAGRILPAGRFVAACEGQEIGRRLDRRALALALDILAAVPSIRLSVNMSARSIGCPGWAETLARGLAGRPTVAERLIVEITESSAILAPDVTIGFIRDLQRRGVAVALDDFGAGYTAFRYLRDFNLDMLKIAGDFVTGVARMPDNRVLARALIDIARHFDIFTVAEAVESAEDAHTMTALGIDSLQGYHFGRPTTRPPVSQPAPRIRGPG